MHHITLRWFVFVIVMWLFSNNILHAGSVGAQTTTESPVLASARDDTANNVRQINHIEGIITDITVVGNKAYINEGSSLTILDISQPATPHVLGKTRSLSAFITGIVVRGDLAYVTAGDAGLNIFDVSNPADPFRVGFYDTPGIANDVYVSGVYAYIADDDQGLRVVDITNPTTLYEVGFYDTLGYATSVAVSGNYAYVAASIGGLRVITQRSLK